MTKTDAMKNEPPLISVLMPVFNSEQYIAQAIESIIRQTYVNIELIAIDDGSTDESLEILKRYSRMDKRIAVHTRENRGISKTRNELVTFARGEYLAWMDSDDISHPNRIERMLEWLVHRDDYVAIGCHTLMIDDSGDVLCEWPQPDSHQDIDDWHINGRGGAIIFPSSMMRKKALIDAGGFDADLTGAEDLDLFLRLAEMGKIGNVPEIMFRYRQQSNSISHKKRQEVNCDAQRAVDSARARRGMPTKALDMNGRFVEGPTGMLRRWAWWALGSGNVRAARKHALRALVRQPMSLANWRLCACALRGH